MYLTKLKKTVLLLTILISSGCSLIPKPPTPIPVEIRTVEVKIPIVHPNMPRAIDLKEPYWYVVSDKNLDTFLADMEKQNGTVVFLAMTVDDYELMAYNMQELRRYINKLKEVVVYYRTMNTDEPEVIESEKPDN
jgi:vacuolar-type H+-ATPase subunit D/Vma8